MYGINHQIEQLENSLTSIDNEKAQIPKRLSALKTRIDQLAEFAGRDDAWLLLPEDIS